MPFRPKLVMADASPAESTESADRRAADRRASWNVRRDNRAKVVPPEGGLAEDIGDIGEDGLPEDFELPDDLRALGERLQEEAGELARQFPTGERDELPRPVRQRPVEVSGTAAGQPARRRRLVSAGSLLGGSLLAGSLLAGAILFLVVATGDERPSRSATRFGAADADRRHVGDRDSRLALPSPAASQTDQGTAPRWNAPASGLFLQEVSGPELEGLLDLMEDDGPACDISI